LQGRTAESLRELRTACEFAPESLSYHQELLRLAERSNDATLIEWTVLAMLRGDWTTQSAAVWAEARERVEKLKAEYAKAGKPEKAAALEKQRREAEATDIIAVMSWNTPGNDIDLHVEEPGNQRVNYTSRSSFRGGSLDHDITTGYGPETYTLRH